MPAIVWSEKLSIGIQSIDVQHRKIVDMINDLQEAMTKGKSKEVLGKIFDDLVSYTAVHFGYEEKLFLTHGYSDSAAHKKEHEDLVNKALDLQKKYKGGNLMISLETLDFLGDWLKKHIQGTDRKYSAYMITKGVR